MRLHVGMGLLSHFKILKIVLVKLCDTLLAIHDIKVIPLLRNGLKKIINSSSYIFMRSSKSYHNVDFCGNSNLTQHDCPKNWHMPF